MARLKFSLNFRNIYSVFVTIVLSGAFFISCARSPIRSDEQAMRLVDAPDKIFDDLNYNDLRKSLELDLERLTQIDSKEMRFGPIKVLKTDYISSIEGLIKSLEVDPSGQLFQKNIKENFSFFEVYGGKNWGEILLTSYYEPEIEGRKRKQGEFSQALYGLPKDLVTLNLKNYAESVPSMGPLYSLFVDQVARDGVIKGRLQSSEVLPYYTREEIDSKNMMAKNSEVLCYVKPVDAFFMHIQGSGRVVLKDKTILRLGYAGQNGHPYKAIGKVLLDVIPLESMSAQKIDEHLRALSYEEAQKIMNQNPSYVFFKVNETEPITYFGTEVVSGRTIATDPKYFPKGALAYLEFKVKSEDKSKADKDDVEKVSSRFVLDQDVGGAIRGPGRVDLFWGRGSQAAQISGEMRNMGRLYYLLPKNIFSSSAH